MKNLHTFSAIITQSWTGGFLFFSLINEWDGDIVIEI